MTGNTLRKLLLTPLAMAGLVLGTGTTLAAGDEHAGHDMSGHDMAGHSTERDEMGRRLYGMKHQMSPEVVQELREKIPLYQGYSDAEIALSMEMMGGNYEWYLSKDGLKADQGVLLLMHGFRASDSKFKSQVESIADIFPTAMAPGMAMMMSQHIQLAIDDLEAAGAKTIVVVPIVSTEYNDLVQQWEYIFGLRDKAPYATVPQVKSKAKVLMASPPGDDPLVAEILLDYAYEMSTDPAKESVIIAAHGPSFEEDNRKALAELDRLAQIMREDGDFANVQGITLQDDSPPEVRDANVAKLRKMVEEANAKGLNTIVVTNLIGTRTIQAKLRSDLKGLDYKFNSKGLTQHSNFMKWMGETVRQEFERNAALAPAGDALADND